MLRKSIFKFCTIPCSFRFSQKNVLNKINPYFKKYISSFTRFLTYCSCLKIQFRKGPFKFCVDILQTFSCDFFMQTIHTGRRRDYFSEPNKISYLLEKLVSIHNMPNSVNPASRITMNSVF